MPKPIRDPRYLAWIRTLPCIVCASTRWIEAAHVGPHGLGQKASDRSTVPLCARHHRTGDDSYHNLGPRKFCKAHRLNLLAIVEQLNRRPQIRVVHGWYIAVVEELEYPLGNTRDGLQAAMSLVPQVAAEALSDYMRHRAKKTLAAGGRAVSCVTGPSAVPSS